MAMELASLLIGPAVDIITTGINAIVNLFNDGETQQHPFGLLPPYPVIAQMPEVPLRTGGISVAPLDGESASKAQALIKSSGMTREQILKALYSKVTLRNTVLMDSLVNIETQHIQLICPLKFWFSHNVPDSGMRDGEPVIGDGDHAFFHIVPNLFNNWEKIKQYEMFFVGGITVKSTIISPDTTSTQVAYFPFTKDTINMTEDEVLTAYNKSSQTKNGEVEYVLTNFSPSVWKLGENQHVTPTDMTIRPNMPFRTEILDGYEKGKVGTNFLSYGTLCFVKQNMSQNDVAVQFNVIMDLVAFNQSSGYVRVEQSQEAPVVKKPAKLSNVTKKK